MASALLAVALLVGLSAIPRVEAQGLHDGGNLGGQTCDAARLEQFETILAASSDYSGGKGRGGKGGTGGKKIGRHLMEGFANEPDNIVRAAGAPDWRGVNSSCFSLDSSSEQLEAILHVASAPAAYIAPIPTVRYQGDCSSCVGYAVASAAEAALGSFMGVPPTAHNFSGNSLYFCGAGGRVCGTSWSVSSAMQTVSGLLLESSLPSEGYSLQYASTPAS